MSESIFSPTSGAVLVAPTAEALVGLWYATTPRTGAPGTGLRFASFAEVEAACAHGGAAIDAAIEVRLPGERARVATTVGRVLLAQALSGRVGFEVVNRSINARAAARILEDARRRGGLDCVAAVARELWSFGARAATESGVSLSIDDLRAPAAKEAILAEGEAVCARIEKQWCDGNITGGERYNALTDALEATEARFRDAVSSELPRRPGLDAMVASGALAGVMCDRWMDTPSWPRPAASSMRPRRRASTAISWRRRRCGLRAPARRPRVSARAATDGSRRLARSRRRERGSGSRRPGR